MMKDFGIMFHGREAVTDQISYVLIIIGAIIQVYTLQTFGYPV